MLKNMSKLEIQIANKIYSFFVDTDSPLEHVKEALFQFSKFIGQIEDDIKSRQAQQSKQSQPDMQSEVKQENPVEPPKEAI